MEEPKEDGSILFVSGDGRDKAYVWSLKKRAEVDVNKEPIEETKDNALNSSDYKTFKIHELEGHSETVEFCKFDSSGRWLVTAGMNNIARVWDIVNGFVLKTLVDEIPVEDMNFVEWHPTAPLFLMGGKDYMIWMVNAVSGKVMANFIGHENEVLMAKFSLFDGGK